MVDLTVDPEIEEVAPTSNIVSGDDIRLEREVSESILPSPENVDVNNIENVLRIPFDYEALMQESSETESNIFSSHDCENESNQGDDGDDSSELEKSHNTPAGIQDHTLMVTSVSNDITPCHSDNVASDYMTDDTLPYQEDEENTDTLNNVTSHNNLDVPSDYSDDEDHSKHCLPVYYGPENKLDMNLEADTSHNLQEEPQVTTNTTTEYQRENNSNVMLDSNDDLNVEIVKELLQTVLSTVEEKLLKETEHIENDTKASDIIASKPKTQISIVSVAPGDDGVEVTKTEKVSVAQTYDKEALIKDINCRVKVRRLKKQDLALWKPMPEPLKTEPNTIQQNKSICNNIRRNPKRKAKDSIDYILCQTNNTDSSEDSTDEFKLSEPPKPLKNLRNPSKDRVKAQEQIAMKKAALALLALRKAHGGGVGLADEDLLEICNETSRAKTNTKLDEYEREYASLIKKLDLPELEDTPDGAILSYNNEEKISPTKELLATTHDSSPEDSSLPATTNKSDDNSEGHDISSTKENVSDYADETDDNSLKDKSSDNEKELSTQDERETATTKTNNVVTNNTYKTEDNDGNKGELNIKCVARKKYRRARKYTCSCGSVFSSQKKINTHYVEEHGMLRCSTCGKPFRTPAAHRKHQYEHLPKQFKCNNCDKEYAFQSQLDSHKISHREQSTFKCMYKKCDKWFKNKGDLTRHVKKHEGKTLYCKFCDYTATAIENLNGHMMKHNKLKRYVCLYCGSGFRWSQERIRHYKNCTKYPN